MRIRWWLAAGAIGFSVLLATRASAQPNDTPWTTPVNLSRSGGASQPLIAVAADGTQHAMWWDQTDGEHYARASITDTTWSDSISVPGIVSARQTDPQTGRETLSPPLGPRLIAVRNDALVLWIDAKGQLNAARSQGATWGAAATLASSALVFDVARDISDTLSLTYIKPTSSVAEPAGIYYRANTDQNWSDAVLVYGSLYFRTATAQDAQISVARANQVVLVAWDDPQLGQSRYARSSDGGRTWSEPQTIASAQNGRTHQAQVATTPNGDLLLMWQDTDLNGCGWIQRRSSDGGNTWNDPQRVLSSLTRCQDRFTFSIAGDSLWLVSRAATDSTAVNVVTLATWNGQAWSTPSDVSIGFIDPTTNRTINLDCLNVGISGQTASVIGCDSIGDVWNAHNSIALTDLNKAITAVWSPVEVLSDGATPAGNEGILATTADRQGNVYALWSQAAAGDATSTALYGSELLNKRWTRPTILLSDPEVSNNNSAHSEQPALVADNHDRIHAVWSSAATGRVYYAWAYTHDFNTANNWSKPVAVPQAASTASWPEVAIGSDDSTVYVIYAAPFNEKRGIYFTRSDDSGTTWWLTPTLVFDAVKAQWESADKPRLVFDPNANVLHAIWLRATLPNSVGPRGVYYARSTDGGETWSQPLMLAAGQVDWPRLALNGPGELVASWVETTTSDQANAVTPLSVVNATSNNSGLQWTAPAQVPGFERVSGPIDVVSDRSGKVYLGAVGQTANGESILIYAEWAGQGWSRSESAMLNQNAVAGNSTAMALAPETSNLTVLMRLWVFDKQNHGSFQIAAMSRAVQSSSGTPAPTFTPQPTATPLPTVTPLPTATPRPQLPDDTQLPQAPSSGTSPLAMGGVLAAIIVAGIFTAVVWRQRR